MINVRHILKRIVHSQKAVSKSSHKTLTSEIASYLNKSCLSEYILFSNIFKYLYKISQFFSVTIVVISRLVYRKGIDLLAGVIPIICAKYPNVNFLIGGDGPKRIDLEEIREQYQLQERVILLGSVRHHDVRDVLVKGDIFLNASLTEAFCIAILEAACCGLQVVTTSVGGVPEVLPPDLVWLTEATVNDLLRGLEEAINDRLNKKIVPPDIAHKRLSKMYQWDDVAERVEKVYNQVIKERVDSLPVRLKKFWLQGYIAGGFFMLLQALEHFLFLFLSWKVPENTIDKAPDLPMD